MENKGPHLDMFKDIRRADAQKMACNTLFPGVDIPEYISVNFDFENKVVIFLNKQSKQTLLLSGTDVGSDNANAES